MNPARKWLEWFEREWASPAAMVIASFLMLCGFWVGWVYLGTGEAPMSPEVLVRVFWTVFKFAAFNATGWIFAFVYFRYSSAEMQTLSDIKEIDQWRVWATIVLCLSVCSLG